MKRIVSVIFIILLSISSLTIASENNYVVNDDQSIYFLLKSNYRFDNGHDIKIVQFRNENRENSFQTVEYFNTSIEVDSDYYQDYDFLTIKDASDTLYLVKYDKPWETKRLKISDVGIRFPLRRDGNTYFGLNVGNYLALMDIDNFEIEEYEIKEGNMADTIIKEEIDFLPFDNENGKLKVRTATKPYRYQPPRDDIGDSDNATLILNNENYILIQLNKYGDNGFVSRRILSVMNKKTEDWSSYNIKGKRIIIKRYFSYIIYKVGTARHPNVRPTYTGEYVIVNYETGVKGEFFLEPPANIYYADKDCIVAKSQDSILYIPIIAGEVKVDQASVIYEEAEDDEENLNISIQYVDGIFLGPKTVPEEILITKAKNANTKADGLYKNEEYDKAVFYYELATEYDPEYAQAYSNLGLSYYNVRRYEKSIKVSLRAIELTDNDIIKASSYYNIAMDYEAMEEWEKALENYREALEYRDHDAYREGIERMEEKIF